MLKLKNVNKDYYVGDLVINALIDVNLSFRKSEFVAILGPSGCGKTTLLNLIGGLDRYTSGDLIINNKSTKKFTDTNWDAYRNHSVGFVFQNYNLISHLSVLKNVELAQTLAGVSPGVRRTKAIEALNKVGLGDQLYKRPNQLSGGQMQRVSIARALVNDPDIILADEPTGALDSKTSAQIGDILKEIAKDRLVIVVTHNEKLAEKYATRVVKLLDGRVIDDSNPYETSETNTTSIMKQKTSMSLQTALSLSGANLLTKKMRTILTSFAASIGIIGVALVLAISSGFSNYLEEAQSDTLANSPITIEPTAILMDEFLDYRNNTTYELFPKGNKIYSFDRSQNDYLHTNYLSLEYEEYVKAIDSNLYNAISFNRQVKMNLMAKQNEEYFIVKNQSINWKELLNNEEYIKDQYDILEGTYPSDYTEIAIVVDRYNRIPKRILDNLRFDTTEKEYFLFEDFIGMEFKLIFNDDFYQEEDEKFSEPTFSQYESIYNNDNAITLTITSVLRIKETTTTDIIRSGILYLEDLTNIVLENANRSAIVQKQLEYGKLTPKLNVLTKQEFVGNNQLEKLAKYHEQLRFLGADTLATSINIYPKGFEEKKAIKEYLEAYNLDKEKKDQIIYTDFYEFFSKTVEQMVNAVSLVLIAFASISLVVSSIMIGIITYVSVIERTKEIGVLRSLGARKKDISRVFNAETMIIGFVAGTLGVFIALILTIPINKIIEKNTQVAGVAQVRIIHALILITVSIVLTLIAGFIPSRIASKKDPVVALRTE